ncbi:hypothetical protein SAMN04489717_1940 [Actinopolymorpha singaporensis]|uniref:DUF2087 domain-containing protein n=1 Tax=Actinopolymorpha singaporensis TaxID=117157 RepID=A0A1H1Q9X8_9ACTN|nr:hypothetical protein SAMN04489717_1940 [Actinopolymorpha singaporensis]
MVQAPSATTQVTATSALATSASLLTTLADPDALRMLGWMLEREPAERGAVSRCAQALGLDAPSTARLYGRLTAVGLIAADGPRIEVRADLLRGAAHELDEINPVVRRLEDFPYLRGMFSHGRLTSMPVDDAHLDDLAYFLASFFNRDVSYTEAEVNEIVREVDDDVATLRRLMVDVGVLTRDRNSVYALADKANDPIGARGPS